MLLTVSVVIAAVPTVQLERPRWLQAYFCCKGTINDLSLKQRKVSVG